MRKVLQTKSGRRVLAAAAVVVLAAAATLLGGSLVTGRGAEAKDYVFAVAAALVMAAPAFQLLSEVSWTSSPSNQTRTRISEIREEIAPKDQPSDTRKELLELESTVAFEDQATKARASSRSMLFIGVFVVVAAIVGGIAEIVLDEARGLSTGDGIVRASVIGAVFYLAGQMFRRATTLERRADDLDRAVVALRHGKDLSKDIESTDLRDKAVAEIYTSHLAARSVDEVEDNTLGDVLAAILKRS